LMTMWVPALAGLALAFAMAVRRSAPLAWALAAVGLLAAGWSTWSSFRPSDRGSSHAALYDRIEEAAGAALAEQIARHIRPGGVVVAIRSPPPSSGRPDPVAARWPAFGGVWEKVIR